MAKKAILLVRVSTERQSFDEQERQLYNMAVKDGYGDEDIIPIAEKESGIKLTEEQRKGLNRLKEVIASEDVAIVYAWEVSRIARKKKILFSILELLVSKKIQLRIFEPSIVLLNEDGSINEASETMFTLFAQMAESEMRNKAARFARGKKANALKAKYSGGIRPKLGYRLDANKYYQIDEKEAAFVRLCYSEYLNSDMGYNRLATELQKRGYAISPFKLRDILSDECYTGRCITRHGVERVYPVIIDQKTWDEVARKRASNDTCANKSSKFYFGCKLITCPSCGKHFMVSSTGVYHCPRHYHHQCDNKTNVDINAMDSILWEEVKLDFLMTMTFDKATKTEEIEQKITILEQKIAICDSLIEKVGEKMQRVANTYINGLIDEATMKAQRDRVKGEAQQAQNDKAQYLAEINNYREMLQALDRGQNLIDRLNANNEAISKMDNLQEMYNIIHTLIANVVVTAKVLEGKRCTEITITHVSGQISKWVFFPFAKGSTKLYKSNHGILTPMTYDEEFKRIVRIERHPKGHKRQKC